MRKECLFIASVLVPFAFLLGCGNGKQVVHPSGTFEATEIDVASVMPARVLSVRYELGETVKRGDTLVVLDTELLGLQKAQIETQYQALSAQRAVLRDQQTQAKTSLKLAESNFERIAALLAEQTSSKQQFDEAQTKRDLAQTQVQMVSHQLAAVDADDAKLTAAVAVIERQLKDGFILAPAAGTIIMKSIESGETVSPQSTLMTLADLNSLELRVYLDEQELDRVKIGGAYSIQVDAISERAIQGTVSWISSEAEFTPKNAQTKSARTQLVYAVKLRVANPDRMLHIGMPAELILP